VSIVPKQFYSHGSRRQLCMQCITRAVSIQVCTLDVTLRLHHYMEYQFAECIKCNLLSWVCWYCYGYTSYCKNELYDNF
jgi:hypothetical protein